jgi:Mg-chelatase subunit ChlD
MAYDSTNDKVVLFGGYDGSKKYDETWEYDTVTHTWIGPYLPNPRPSARYKHQMDYDSVNNRIVLFGGYDGSNDDETWEYDTVSHTWHGPYIPSPHPSARQNHDLVYDSINNRIVLFGGWGGTNADNTWEYETSSHTWYGPYKPTPRPSPRVSHAMAFDIANNKVVLFGGFKSVNNNETWEYDTSSHVWTGPLSLSKKPSAREILAMAFDSINNKVVLFGGWDGDYDDETWEYTHTSSPITHNFTVTVRVNSDVPNGTILTNTVTLDYTDSKGSSMPRSTSSVDVLVLTSEDQPPVAIAGPNQTVNEGDLVQFDGSASYQPNGTIESYQWDFDTDFDSDSDGNKTNDVDGTGPTPTHVYGDDGVYNVTLTVKSLGEEGSVEKVDQDAVFCVDVSGSMEPASIPIIKDGLTYYVNEMSVPDQGAVVLYGGPAYLINPLTDVYSDLLIDIREIPEPPTGPNTPMGDAMNISIDELLLNGNENHTHVIILLTDGMNNAGTHYPIIEAYNAASHNITIYTIGLGPSVNEPSLMQIAAVTGGKYYYAPNATLLISIYQGIAQLVEYPGGPPQQDSDTMQVTVNNVAPIINISQNITEEWVAKYNGPDNYYDITYSMIVDSSGNVYVTGGSQSNDGENYTTVKYDTNGNELWVAHYNGPANKHDHSNDITVDSLGNVYVTGKSGGTTSRWDYATIKYDPNGNEIWVKRYNGGDRDIAYAITVDTQGNIYITGQTDDKYNTIKYDANGNQIWNSKYEGSSGEAMDIVVDDLSGNVYVFGRTETDLTTVAYDQDGNELWIKKYGSCYYFSPRSRYIVMDSLGNVYVVGTIKGNETSHDFTTIKYDSLGNEIWVAKYNSPGNGIDQAFGIDLDSSGNVYVTGCSYFPSPRYRECTTVKYDQNGNEIWVANYGNGSGRGIRVDDSLGLIYVIGTSSNASIATMTTIAYDQDGNELWVGKYNGPGGEDKGIFIDVDPSGNVYVSGYSKGNGTYIDFCTIKYSTTSYYEFDEGSSITFIANATDPGSDDLTFTWNWGDGTPDTVTTYYNDGVNPEPFYNSSSNEIKSPWGTYPFNATDTVSHIYGDDGVYIITLTIEDDDGGITVTTINVTVINVAPTIDLNGPFSGDEGSPISFTGNASDPGSDDLIFTWEFELGPTISNNY